MHILFITYCILYHTDYIKYLIILNHCWSMINYISWLLVQYQSFPIGAIIFANMGDCVDYCEGNHYHNNNNSRKTEHLNTPQRDDDVVKWNDSDSENHKFYFAQCTSAIGPSWVWTNWNKIQLSETSETSCGLFPPVFGRARWKCWGPSGRSPHKIMVCQHLSARKLSSNLDWNVKLMNVWDKLGRDGGGGGGAW